MATPAEVVDMVQGLADAGLSYTPPADRLGKTADMWVSLFDDIPGEILTIAARDYLMTETTWPAPAKLRKLAETVKAHNGTSAAPNRFKDDNIAAGCIPGIAVVCADRWRGYRPGDIPRLPADIAAKIEAIAARLGDKVMTEEQHAYIDNLMGAWLEANV